MKKSIFLALVFLGAFSLSHPVSADTCSISSDSTLRALIRQYAAACGGEGDFVRRFSPECTDYNNSASTEANRRAYQAECPTATPCGCLRAKSCASDPLYSELSCTVVTVPPPGPETRPRGCGDGIVQTDLNEQCEPPYAGNCNEVCRWVESKCGDGRVDFGTGEECEPPATRHDGWECNEYCKVKKVPPAPKCGDGAVNQKTEECEPAGTATCDANCKVIKFCGDGVVQPELGEQCERPNTEGCDQFCKKIARTETPPPPHCGNGVLETNLGEQCEKAGVGNCSSTCTIVDPGETPLVTQTEELFLEGSGLRCSMTLNLLRSNPWQGLSLFLSFGALAAIRLMRRKD